MKRLVERTYLIYHLRVFGSGRQHLLGHLVNITPDGMQLISENAIDPGIRQTVFMDLPRNVLAENHLILEAESRWCRKESRAEFFNIGFQIFNLSPENVQIIRTLIQEFYREELPDEDPELDMNPLLGNRKTQ